MTLHVVRHGRTEANAGGLLLGRADPGLDDVGRGQAQAIAASLPVVDRVISSPLRRCVDTARTVHPEPEIDERLIELDYGELDLTPLSDVPAEIWRQWRADADFRPPGGETLRELAVRVSAVLDDLAVDAADSEVVVVTHVSPIKAALAWALGVGVEISWRTYVAQASITRIRVGGNGPSLLAFNDESHLASSG